jgi:tryptophanyl-tRNA synthetase
MHFGNYFGAVENWVNLQKKYDCFFGIVDYHAMTMPYKPDKLRQNTWDLAIKLLACGIKEEHLFIQSLVPEHSELGWIFNCFCSYGQLTRMTQFKDKSTQSKQTSSDNFISVGLLDYPVLQAADILIYKADFVPVGQDQDQHLELTRNIAQRFNNQVGKEYFVLPETIYTKTPKIRSTADPSRKMSKSAGPKHNISVFADEAIIRKQIKSAVTDTGVLKEGEMSEGIENLFEMLRAGGRIDLYDQFMSDFKNSDLKYVDLKEATANTLVTLSNTFKEKKKELDADKKAVKNRIKESSAEIRKVAQQTIKEVKELTGIMNVRF